MYPSCTVLGYPQVPCRRCSAAPPLRPSCNAAAAVLFLSRSPACLRQCSRRRLQPGHFIGTRLDAEAVWIDNKGNRSSTIRRVATRRCPSPANLSPPCAGRSPPPSGMPPTNSPSDVCPAAPAHAAWLTRHPPRAPKLTCLFLFPRPSCPAYPGSLPAAVVCTGLAYRPKRPLARPRLTSPPAPAAQGDLTGGAAKVSWARSLLQTPTALPLTTRRRM